MTPEPSHNVVVPVSLAGIAVSLGYATVDGFWRQQRANPVGRWMAGRLARATTWKPRALPVTSWHEKIWREDY